MGEINFTQLQYNSRIAVEFLNKQEEKASALKELDSFKLKHWIYI